MRSTGPLPPTSSLQVLKSVALGLREIHKLGYRHNDLKPANVLLNVSDSGEIKTAITDFGSCGPLTVDVSSRKEALSVMDFHSRCTTAPYRAPELWDVPSDGCELSGKSDVFSLGCLHYFNTFGKQAFDFNVGKITLPEGRRCFGVFEVEICLGMVLLNPGERMGVEECLDALEAGEIGRELRGFVEREYRVELKRERGDYDVGGTGGVEDGFGDFAMFRQVRKGVTLFFRSFVLLLFDSVAPPLNTLNPLIPQVSGGMQGGGGRKEEEDEEEVRAAEEIQ